MTDVETPETIERQADAAEEGAPAAADKPQPERARSLTRKVALPSLAVVGGLGSLGALDLLRKRYQKRQLFLPERFPSGTWEPSHLGLKVEDCWFESEDGVRLHGWWIAQENAAGTILYCHGQSGSIGHRVGVFRALRKLGMNLFAFDYRGYGRSEGKPSEEGLSRDVRAAHDYLTAQRGLAHRRLVLFGNSLGGAVAVEGASQRPVAGLIVQASFTDVRSMARSRHRKLPLHWLASNQFRSIAKVGALAMPKLFVHGTRDRVVPIELGRELFEAAADPKRFLAIEGAGHHDIERKGGEPYFAALRTFAAGCVE
jgi:hypothetical protein